MYWFIRKTLDVPLMHGQLSPDILLKKIHSAILDRSVCDVISDSFVDAVKENA